MAIFIVRIKVENVRLMETVIFYFFRIYLDKLTLKVKVR